jgi:hypothetical protein
LAEAVSRQHLHAVVDQLPQKRNGGTVMLTEEEKKARYYLCWSDKTIKEAVLGMNAITKQSRRLEYIRNAVPKFIYYGVKAYSIPHGLDVLSPEDRYAYMERIVDVTSLITPRQFMTIFPIDKDYDGDKYGTRDYFTTVADAIKLNGIDKPIKEPFKFLMNYWNHDVLLFVVNMTTAMSDIHKEKTGKNLFTQFLEDNGLKADWGNDHEC